MRNETNCQIFIDGKLTGTSPDVQILGGKFMIGTRYLGDLKESRLSRIARYSKDFTPEQRFNPDKDTIALYHCDDSDGDTLKDSSGNNHHAKIVGAVLVK